MIDTWVGFDIETRGSLQEYALQPYRLLSGTALITAASVIQQGQPDVGQLYPQKEFFKDFLDRSAADGKTIVGWNTVFDCAWLIALGLYKEVNACSWYDGMLFWKHLFVEPEKDSRKRKSYSLEAAMHEFYPDDAGFKEFKDFQDTSEAGMKQLLHRNIEDSRYAMILADKFYHQLTLSQRRAAIIESRCIPMVALTHVVGLKMNREKASQLSEDLDTEYQRVIQELHTQYPETKPLNLGSPKQLSTLLFDTWKLPSTKQTKGTEKNPEGNRSTDKEVLFDLALSHPQANLVKTARECQNNRAKYAEATIESLDYNGDGRSRPQARIFGTYTSRMTYNSKQGKNKYERPTGVALHQWKRGKEYRGIIEAPDGYDLVELDFAGQEFRWMAVASEDETMLGLCQAGEDGHGYMGAQVTGQEYRDLVNRVKLDEKEANHARKLGKFCNLSFQYRIGSKAATAKARVEYGLDISESEIKNFLATYKASYSQVPNYWLMAVKDASNQGYAETFAGRRVQLKGPWGGRSAWEMESTAINYPIQGTGGDQKYLALAVARNLLPQMRGYMYFELHDGLFFILPKATSERGGRILRKELSNLPYKQAWGINLPIQFPVDLKIGPNWGELKGVE